MGGKGAQTRRVGRSGERKVTLRRQREGGGGGRGCFSLIIVGSLAQLSSLDEMKLAKANPSMAAFYRSYLLDLDLEESDRSEHELQVLHAQAAPILDFSAKATKSTLEVD